MNDLAQYRRDKENEEAVKEIADKISSLVNVMGNEKVVHLLAEHITEREHRYLQTEIFQHFILKCITNWADDYIKNRFDDRNKWTCEMSFLILKEMSKYDRFYLSYFKDVPDLVARIKREAEDG